MGKCGGRRNFGWGKKMAYAASMALEDSYGGSRPASCHEHAERFGHFAAYCVSIGISDGRYVTRDTVLNYGLHLRMLVELGGTKVSYAQNLLSSVNVAIAALRGDHLIDVSPSLLVGPRRTIRIMPPSAMDRSAVGLAAADLRARGHERAACVIELARDLGTRERESCLINSRIALNEARRGGCAFITEGTKGGRGRWIDRIVPVSAEALASLHKAAAVQGKAKNLVPAGKAYAKFRDHVTAVAIPALRRQGCSHIHDLRASYACDRYIQITGCLAPCMAGFLIADRASDRAAREILAQELGHSRIDVIGAYIGGRQL